MLGYKHVKLDVPVNQRYDVYGSGLIHLKKRDQPHMIYGLPTIEQAFIWPETTDRFVVACSNEVHTMPKSLRTYGCFHVFPTLEAATMFAIIASPEPKERTK